MNKNKKQKNQKPHSSSVIVKPPAKDLTTWLLGACLFLTFIAYLPALKGEFVNWDDDDYVVHNPYIHSLSSVKELLTIPVQGNYHPLTMLSLALNYSISGEQASSYHWLNLVLHLLNTFLVFKLASRLSRNNNIISFASALLFGIHPMHAESVAWVSERKDVLYGFFFILGLISYLKYTDTNSRSAYVLSIIWFLFSLASKPAAIIFPVVLFTIDFFRKRKFSLNLFTEKIPYMAFSALLAYLTLHAQKTIGATDTGHAFTMVNRIFFVFYGYMMYFLKMILPVNLSAFYPLPPINESLPFAYYIAPVFFLATIILSYAFRKKYPVIAFSFGFYFINLLLVLQLFIIGSAIIADRYTYIPYIGLFFLFGWFLDYTFKQKPSAAYAILITVGIFLTFSTYQQAGTWKNSAALWDNAIANVPSSRAYDNRATLYRKEGKSEKAFSLYNEAIKMNKADHEAYCNRANVYFDLGNDSLAMSDYTHALQLKSDYVPALDNRGALYAREGKLDLAFADLNRALQLKPDYKSAYSNRAVAYMNSKQFENAIHDFESYLKYDPNDVEKYNAIGVCYQSLGKYELSIKSFSDAINFDAKPLYYLNRSFSWNALGKLNEARKDALQAKQRGMQIPAEYLVKMGL